MKVCLTGLVAVAFAATSLGQTAFTPGDLVVLQVGDGSTALSSAAAPVYADEFSLIPGTMVQQLAVPSSGSGLVLSGTTATEGALTLSPNGTFLTFAGYSASAGTAGISTSTVGRSVGVFNFLGGFSTVAPSGSTAFSGSYVSSGVSDNNSYWMSGNAAVTGNGGLWYSTGSGAPVQVAGGTVRNANIFNGNLLYSSGSGTLGIFQFTGLPTGTATASALFTEASGSPNDFALSADGKTMYVADDGTFATRGIQKWVNNSGTWSLAYRLAVGNSAGARQLAVQWGTTPIIFATTSETVSNRVVEIVDNGSAGSSTTTTLDTAGANTLYRGVDFAPIPEPSVVAVVALGALTLVARRSRMA